MSTAVNKEPAMWFSGFTKQLAIADIKLTYEGSQIGHKSFH